MELRLAGKKALVCGASDGIGKACAMLLAEEGVQVTLLARNKEKLISVKNTLAGKGHSILVADMDNPEQLKSVLESHISHSNSYEILINNSGGPAAGPVSNAKTEEFLLAFNRHLICNHILATQVLPYMREKKWGRIINIISTSVKVPLPNLGVSNTIRGAVANWAKTLANENAIYGITINNVLPGATLTGRLQSIMQTKSEKTQHSLESINDEMKAEIPMKRFGTPEEIASAVCFLASDNASYITGINLPVDGGRTPSL